MKQKHYDKDMSAEERKDWKALYRDMVKEAPYGMVMDWGIGPMIYFTDGTYLTKEGDLLDEDEIERLSDEEDGIIRETP